MKLLICLIELVCGETSFIRDNFAGLFLMATVASLPVPLDRGACGGGLSPRRNCRPRTPNTTPS